MNSFSRFVCLVGIAAAVLIAHPVDAVTVRFEAESTGAVKDKGDAVGYGNFGIMGRAAEGTASNGELLFTTGTDRKAKIVFAGTGIDLIAPETGDGAQFDWSLDEGAQTGTGTTIGAGGPQTAIPIVSGLPNGLHTLLIGKSNLVDFVLRIDAFDVHDSGERIRIEQDDPSITYNPAPLLLNDTAASEAFDTEASAGSVATTIDNSQVITVPFSGTGIAAIFADRLDGLVFNYDIDGGAVTGSFDTSALAAGIGGGVSNRTPYLLANSLSNGPHTLTLTAQSTGAAGNVNFVGFIDAFDVFVPEPGSLALVGLGIMVASGFGCRRRS